jgi:XTP/dITP diphosphohydrolase
MKKIVVASGNSHKIKEISEIFKDKDIMLVSMKEAGFGDEEIEETGETFEENSLLKAKAVMKKLGGDVIADDSGLEVDALDGRPGVYSARYAGEKCTYMDNNAKLIDELRDVEDLGRGAKFVTVITYLFENGEKIVARGEVRGKIGYNLKGDNGFGYDPLFIVDGLGKTYAELSADEKNKLSHRSKALEILKEKLDRRK